jgi:YidC/Oxa1 family membrane protein insertase
MLDALHVLLFPIVWTMAQILRLLMALLGSPGAAIIALSLVMTALTWPLQRLGARHEGRVRATLLAMEPQLAEARRRYKGEERFHAIDAIYGEHRWHPIKATMTATGFLISVPLLISSLLLLIDHPALRGQPFLAVPDLAQPDGLLRLGGVTINLLPIAMSVVAILDARLKPAMDAGTRRKFYVVSLALLALTYAMPAAVILYWLSNNLWALAQTLVARARP